MPDVQTALLFLGNPTLVLERYCETLEHRLGKLGTDIEEISPQNGARLSLNISDVTLSVHVRSSAMAADSFAGALDSPLSKAMIGHLAETLARHSRSMTISMDENDRPGATGTDHLTRLRIVHMATTLLAEWHMPAAVHWRQSNQLLTGAQYLQLAKDPAPWALFAQARIFHAGQPDQMDRLHGLRLDEAAQFIGRPVEMRPSSLPMDEMHAAALSFVRYVADNGEPIADGHTFGARGGMVFQVSHIDPTTDQPEGKYELSVVEDDTDRALGDAARLPKAVKYGREVPLPDAHEIAGVAAPHPRERTRSMAIGYLMLVIMPPVGAILLMSNAIFGSNFFRTSMVAAASVAVALLVGTYTFVNNGEQTAALFETDAIHSAVLSD